MLLHDFLTLLETTLPPSTAMQGDRLGLQVQNSRESVNHVLCCLDTTEEVLAEARTLGADTVLSFHPLIFRSMANITNQNRIGRCVQFAIRNDISLISAHTNFDAHPKGTNEVLARALGLTPLTPLVPDPSVSGHGMGLVCSCAPCDYTTLLERVRQVCSPVVRHSVSGPDQIERVAIVGGSGFSFLDDAIRSGAQVFITADLKYHSFFEADGRIALIDPGHYEMEQFVPKAMSELLSSSCSDSENAPRFSVTSCNTNPLRYHHQAE